MSSYNEDFIKEMEETEKQESIRVKNMEDLFDDDKRFYYKKHIKGSIDNFEVAECWCYETGKIAPFLVTTEGYAENVIKLLNHLHQENHYLSTIRENQQQMILKLKEENEQLRQQLKEIKENPINYFQGDGV